MTPEETVRAFISAVTGGDHSHAAEFVADDIVYENIGFGPTSFEEPVPTINGAKATFEFLAPIKDAEWIIHRDQSFGNVVVNERTDKFTMNGMRIEIPVAGIFEVVDGKITFWRDYCDMQTLTNQMTGA
jgi:limonene-1,2-epoxide hydrolase